MGVFVIFFTLFLWASSFALSKVALEASAPLFATGVRMVIAGVCLYLIARYRKEHKPSLTFLEWSRILVLAFTGFYLANVFEFTGLQGISSSRACFIYGLSPFLSAMFSYLQMKEHLTVRKAAGLTIGIVGYFCYLVSGSFFSSFSGSFLGFAEIMLISATVVSAFGWTLMRKIEKTNRTISVIWLNAVSMLLSGVLSLAHSYCVEDWGRGSPIVDFWVFARALGCLIVLSNLVCYNLYGWLLKRFSSTLLSFCCLVMPIFSGFYGFILLGETLSWGLIVAVISTLFGFRMIYSEEFKQGYVSSAEGASEVMSEK